MKMLRTLRITFLILSASFALSNCGPTAEVNVVRPSEIGSYDLICVIIDDEWVRNHSSVTLLQQELLRRGFAVRQEEPPEELRHRSMRLLLEHAGGSRRAGQGKMDILKAINFRLEGPDGELLATASYEDDKLDPIDQRELMRDIADQLFGS